MPIETMVHPETFLKEQIRHAIKQEIAKEVEKVLETAYETIENRIAEIVAGISIRLMEYIDMESLGNKLIITINMDTKKGENK